MATIRNVYEALCELAPIEWKMDFDNPGLLVGRPDREVKTTLAALDITNDVISEASAMGAELIVSHHPLFFDAKNVLYDTLVGEKIISLIENGIGAICMHTNLDVAPGGVNDALADALGLHDTHPVVEDGVDVRGTAYGLGRYGSVGPMDLDGFLRIVKAALGANGIRYVDGGKPVNRVAVCGGSGGSELARVRALGCDTYVTGDVKYNQFLDARELGVNLIDAGHFPTENVVMEPVVKYISQRFPEMCVAVSKVHRQPEMFI